MAWVHQCAYPDICSEHTMHNVNHTESTTGVPAVYKVRQIQSKHNYKYMAK